MRLALLALMLWLAGCSSAPPDDPQGATPPPQGDVTDSSPGKEVQAQAPAHPVGTAWTYSGYELYNSDSTFTVVVAEASDDGYLFAAGAKDDLVYHALWRSSWYGIRDLDMDAVEGDNLLEFPLEDGKSWPWREDRMVTARRALVQTPTGPDDGFVIEGERIRYEYSPKIGQIVRWERHYQNGLGESLNLTAVEVVNDAIWYESGNLVAVPNPHEPKTFDVADGFDAVLVSTGGLGGSKGIVTSPSGQSTTFDFPAEGEAWQNAILSPDVGTWSAAVLGRPFVDDVPVDQLPVGWAYMHVMPVRWQAHALTP